MQSLQIEDESYTLLGTKEQSRTWKTISMAAVILLLIGVLAVSYASPVNKQTPAVEMKVLAPQPKCNYIKDAATNLAPTAIPSCSWTSETSSVRYECINATHLKKTTYNATGCPPANKESQITLSSLLLGAPKFDCSNAKRPCRAVENVFRVAADKPKGFFCDRDGGIQTLPPSQPLSQLNPAGGVCWDVFGFGEQFKSSCNDDGFVLDHYAPASTCSGLFYRKSRPFCSRDGTTLSTFRCQGMPNVPFPKPSFKREACGGGTSDTSEYQLGKCYDFFGPNFAEEHKCGRGGLAHFERLFAGNKCERAAMYAWNQIRTDMCSAGVVDECESPRSHSFDGPPEIVRAPVGITGLVFNDNNCAHPIIRAAARAVYFPGVIRKSFGVMYQVVCQGGSVKELRGNATSVSYGVGACTAIDGNAKIIGKRADGSLLGKYIRFLPCGHSA